MGIFSLFKSKKENKIPRGFHAVKVKAKEPITQGSVKLIFEIPADIKSEFDFIPGQYINFAFKIGGHDIRRSYSICSGVGEDLAVGVKRVKAGEFSSYVLDKLQVGDEIFISKPSGNFRWNKESKSIVAFTAGSGITPILSIAKSASNHAQKMSIFFGNKMVETTMFTEELKKLGNSVTINNFYSQQEVAGAKYGRMTKENIIDVIKEDLSILTADAFYLCGPEDMIMNAQAVLSEFGVANEKIHFELFKGYKSLPDEDKHKKHERLNGTAHIKVILDDEEHEFDMSGNETVLQKALDLGIDAPYSCKGGVCQTCRCKIIEGTADMQMNFTLSKKDIENGYILSCQAHPTSENLTVTYDE